MTDSAAQTVVELVLPPAPELDDVRRHTQPFALLVAAVGDDRPVVAVDEMPDECSDDPTDYVVVTERVDAATLRQHRWYPLAEAVYAASSRNEWVVDEADDGACTLAYRFPANADLVLAAAEACGIQATARPA